MLCDPFQTKILPSFPQRFSGSATALKLILSVLHSNITNLLSHLPSVQQNTQVTLSERIYFQIPPCSAETTQETRRNIKADSITLCGHKPRPMAQQPKEVSPDIKFQEQAPKIKPILSHTVNHGTRKSKEAKNCFWVPQQQPAPRLYRRNRKTHFL